MESESIVHVGQDVPSYETQLSKSAITTEGKPPVLLVHRVPSANIDMTSFSFAKPIPRQIGFSSRGIAKQGTIDQSVLYVSGKGNAVPIEPVVFDGLAQKPANRHEDSDQCMLQADRTMHPCSPNRTDHSKSVSGSGLNTLADIMKSNGVVSKGSKGHISPVHKVQRTRQSLRSSGSSGVKKARRERRTPQMSEERIFELLIAKIRMREEKETAIADMQQQLDSDNKQLKTENQGLLDHITMYEEQLETLRKQQTSRECQLKSWKERMLKFKQIVNELGHDFEVLRNDADKQKEATSSLQNERDELTSSINDIKLHIARADGTIEDQRIKISGYERKVCELEQALVSCRARLEESLVALLEEKKRASSLEVYIQNYSRSQIRQVNMLRKDHAGMFGKLGQELENIHEASTTTRDTILSEIRATFEESRFLFEELRERRSTEARDVQDFTNTVHDIAVRIDVLATHLTSDVELATEANLEASRKIEENTKAIECTLGSESIFCRQLDSCKDSHESFGAKMGDVSPILDDLGTSVKSLKASGDYLVHELKGLSASLREFQSSNQSPRLELELSNKLAENANLELRVQKFQMEVVSLRESLNEREAENQGLKKLIEELRAKDQVMKQRGLELESENTSLREHASSSEEKTREMVEEQKLSTKEEMKLYYNEQIEMLQKEKQKLEDTSGELIGQLQQVQDSLACAQKMIDNQREERADMLRESDQKIQELTKTKCEIEARMTGQAEAIQRYQELEAASCSERNDLQENLRQAHEQIHELEQEKCPATVNESSDKPQLGSIVPFSAIKSRMPSDRAIPSYYDSGDFAMLFMSDDLCPSSPFNVDSTKQPSAKPDENLKDERDLKLAGHEATSVSSPSPGQTPIQNQSSVQSLGKRKAVNFNSQPQCKKYTRTPSAKSVKSLLSQTQNDPDERPNNVTRHVQKWTYSKIRSSGTEIRRQEPARLPQLSTVGRRTSPKGLVSATSGNNVPKRTNGRGWGKRNTRGERYSARFGQED